MEQRRPDKNVRAEKSEVVRLLFELFKEKPQWTTKELRERTKQPEAWLKEILQGLCSYNRAEHAWSLSNQA